LLFLAVVVLYLPTLRGGFVYDSIAQVLYSDYIHTPAHWMDVLTLRVVGEDELDRNRPLLLASLMTDAAVWGRNPFGYRLTSVLLHALNATLLFALLTIALPRGENPWSSRWPAAFGALLFAAHPLVVEAVAEPSNREDLLVLLPMLIGLLVILAPIRSTWVANIVLVACSFFAVLAKESGIAVPFVLALAAGLRGEFRRSLPGLLGRLFVAAGFLFASYIWRPSESGIFVKAPGGLQDGLWPLLSVQSRIWTLQLWQILWPWNLSAHYSAGAIAGISLPLAVFALTAVVVAAIVVSRADRLAALGAAVYILSLLPASNLAAQYHPVADRYLYVPLAGVGMLAAALACRLRSQHSRGLAGGAIVAGLLLLLALEYAANLRRQFIWQEPAALWSDVLRQYPNTSQAQIGVANVHYRAGEFEAARSLATEAVVSSGGDWADAWALRAICEWQTGAREPAMASLLQAKRLSRAYRNENSAAASLIFSPEQLAVLTDLMRAAEK